MSTTNEDTAIADERAALPGARADALAVGVPDCVGGAAAVAEVLIAARKRRRVMRNSTALDHGEGIAGDVFSAPAPS